MKIIPPPETWGSITSNAEKRVANLLAQVDLGPQATCLYSLHLPRHKYKRMSEADFVVLAPHALIVLEVKGGRIGRREGLWTFTDRYGSTNTKREGPFDQARSAMFALEALLRERLPRTHIATGYLVLTPDQELGDDLEWERVHHAGPATMTVARLEHALRSAIDHWSAKRAAPPGAYAELVRALRPDFDLVPSLNDRAANLRSEYIELAERQYELVAGAERNPRLLCIGGAGSGKTLLAVETAARAASQGRDVLLTCLSPGLARYLRTVLNDTSVRVHPFAETRAVDSAEVLVVDEAQDLMDLDSYLALDGLVQNGLDHGTWRIFCDPNNQAAVDGAFDRSVLAALESRATTIDLPYNCRNPVPVVQQTQDITGADLGVARAGAGPNVDFANCATPSEAAARLDAHLKRLRRDEVDLETVAVVTLQDEPADSAAMLSRHVRNGSLRRYDGDPTNIMPGAARLMTVAEVKGLEAEHVCVIDVADVEGNLWRSKLYVAMSRPTISLWIALDTNAWTQIADQRPRHRSPEKERS